MEKPELDGISVIFHGTRGSHTVFGNQYNKYGGKTTCNEVFAGSHRLLIDAGTGIIGLGNEMVDYHRKSNEAISTTLLFTHTHLDHMVGIPFFKPVYFQTTKMSIFGPNTEAGSIEEVMRTFLTAPFHPVPMDELGMQFTCTDLIGGEILRLAPKSKEVEIISGESEIGPDDVIIKVSMNPNHPTLGVLHYRIEYHGKSYVFATDVEGTEDGEPILAEFAKDADLLAHDGMYIDEEMKMRTGWGHSTWKRACATAKRAGVKSLALIHHDPDRDDDAIDAIEIEAQKIFKSTFAATDGMEVLL